MFNDGAFANLTDRELKMETQLILEHGNPMIFGKERNKGMCLAGAKLEVVEIGETSSIDDILVHDETNKIQGLLLSELTHKDGFPTPIGIIYREEKPTYENLMYDQMDKAVNSQGEGDLDTLFRNSHTWKV